MSILESHAKKSLFNTTSCAVTSSVLSTISYTISNPFSNQARYVSVLQHSKAPVIINLQAKHNTSVFDKSSSSFKRKLLTEEQTSPLTQSIQSKIPTTISNTVAFTPNVFYSLKSMIANDMTQKAQNLKKRKNGSVLYGQTYESLAGFEFQSIWNEMKTNFPYLIDIFSAVAGLSKTYDDIEQSERVKFCFIYSILMNINWNSLSLLQRMNTVLMLEGGGSKKVSLCI